MKYNIKELEAEILDQRWNCAPEPFDTYWVVDYDAVMTAIDNLKIELEAWFLTLNAIKLDHRSERIVMKYMIKDILGMNDE